MGKRLERDERATAELWEMASVLGPTRVARGLHIGQSRFYEWKDIGVPVARAEEVHELFRIYMATPEPRTCRHNSWVECSEEGKACETCGWNPEVAKKRTKAFHEKLRKDKTI